MRHKPKKPRIIKNPQRNARLRLRRRKPEEWLAAVETIEDRNLRTQVACTIRWDYFSNREGKNASHHLDRFLAAWTKDISITAADHRAALVQCGYTQKLAEERVPDNHSLFRVNDNQENDPGPQRTTRPTL